MEVQPVQTQHLTTLHLVQERGARLLQTLTFGVAEVYEIAVVRQNLRCRISILLAGGTKSVYLFCRQCGRSPLTLILCEERKSRSSNLGSIAWSVIHTARSAHVCTKIFHKRKKLVNYISTNVTIFSKNTNFANEENANLKIYGYEEIFCDIYVHSCNLGQRCVGAVYS